MAPKELRYIAHRVQGYGHPENSEAALRAALASTADEVELDIRLTRNGLFLASHWPLALRSSEGRLDLESILRIARENAGDKHLRLDLKTVGEEARLLRTVQDAGMLERVTFMSRNTTTLRRIIEGERHARISRTIILSGLHATVDRQLYRHALEHSAHLQASPVPLTLARLGGQYSRDIILSAVQRDAELVVCVQSQHETEQLIALGVRMFLSNRPLLSPA